MSRSEPGTENESVSGPENAQKFEFKAKTSRYTINKVLYSVPCASARETFILIQFFRFGNSGRVCVRDAFLGLFPRQISGVSWCEL